jgi:hypothetical protein
MDTQHHLLGMREEDEWGESKEKGIMYFSLPANFSSETVPLPSKSNTPE